MLATKMEIMMTVVRGTWTMDQAIICASTKKNFMELDEKISNYVFFEGSLKVQMRERGTILIFSKNGGHVLITNVYFVLNLRRKILSLDQFLTKRYEIHMKDCSLWFKIKVLI